MVVLTTTVGFLMYKRSPAQPEQAKEPLPQEMMDLI